MFPGPLGHSLTGRALEAGLWRLEPRDIRDAATDRHRTVDDSPAGGGAGMVLRADIAAAALDAADTGLPRSEWPVICLSPRGRRFDQARARALASGPGVTLLCGRFEGIDQRVLDARAVEEVSLGDFVMTGGEIAAQALIDACVRLIPRVLGNAESTEEEVVLVRPLGVSALHAPDRLGRSADPRGSPLGTPRTHRRLATHPGGKADTDTSSRPLAGLPGEGRASGPGRRGRALGREHHRRDRRAREGRPVMNLIAQLEAEQIRALAKDIPDFAAGDTVRVGYKVTEGTRSRVQAYEGVCIARNNGSGIAASFTVRKISFGEGVERVFPLHSPNIDSITVVRRGKVRRAKLYYLRERRGKSARIIEKTNYREKTEG